MLKRRLLVSLTAATLAGAAAPAAAVIMKTLAAITDTVSVDSDTEAYDLWASTCPNVSAGGTCGTATGALSPDSDNTLFFWGLGGNDPSPNPNNTRIQIEWTEAAPSEVIRSVRIRTTGTTPLGQAAGPLSFMSVDFSNDPGWEANFSSTPRPSGAGTLSQGQGSFLAYGRDVYAFDHTVNQAHWTATRDAIYPVFTSLEVGVFGPGPQTGPTTDVVLSGTEVYDLFTHPPGGSTPPGPREAQQKPLDFTVNLPNGDRGVLTQGDVLEIEFFVETFDAGEVPGTVPFGYMDDIVIQLNPGPRLQATPDGSVSIGATRAGTVTEAAARGSIEAENIGGDDGSGNTVLDGQFNAVTNDAGNPADGAIQPVGGNGVQSFALSPSAVDTRDYELDATAFELTLADQGSTGESFSATQRIVVTDAADFGGPQTRTLQSTVVGPILGVNDGSRTLEYGVDEIDLGTVGIGDSCHTSPADCPAAELAIANLFGSDLGDLTNLSIRNVALGNTYGGRISLLGTDAGGNCNLSSSNPYPDDGTPVVIAATGSAANPFPVADLCIHFDPMSYPGGGMVTGPDERTVVFDTTLRFFTDMNMDFDTFGAAGEKFFDLTVTAVYAVTPSAPVPAPLALIGIGLAGLGGLRARSRRGAEPKRQAG